MRTTVDLPPLLHARAVEIARERGVSLSRAVADLAARGLAASGEPARVSIDPVSRLPVLHIGRPITGEDVAAALDDA